MTSSVTQIKCVSIKRQDPQVQVDHRTQEMHPRRSKNLRSQKRLKMLTTTTNNAETKSPETGVVKKKALVAEAETTVLPTHRVAAAETTDQPLHHQVHCQVHPTAVAVEVIRTCIKESTPRNPKWAVSQTDAMGKRLGSVENPTASGQGWKHPTWLTFLNHLK